jgi:hypothetical protein
VWLLWPWGQPCFKQVGWGQSQRYCCPTLVAKVSCLTFHVDGTFKQQVAVEVRGRRALEQGLVEPQIVPGS